jgi:hypothetical protein
MGLSYKIFGATSNGEPNDSYDPMQEADAHLFSYFDVVHLPDRNVLGADRKYKKNLTSSSSMGDDIGMWNRCLSPGHDGG